MTALPFPDEKELLIQLGSGNRRAFDQIYHSYKDRIYSNLLKLVRTDDLAEELLQETFYKLWLNREQLYKIQSFSAYLYRIAANLVADFYRKAALDKKLQEQLARSMTELYNDVEEKLDYKESHALMQRAIKALPPQRKTVYQLCKIEGKSYEEVSHILGISTSTINDHIVKATRSIRKQFTGSADALIILITAYWLHL